MRKQGFTLVEMLLMIAIVGAIAFALIFYKPRTAMLNTTGALGGLRAYLNAQSIYESKFKVYGSLRALEITGLDPLVLQATAANSPLYAGYWFDDSFTGVNLSQDYQCICTPAAPGGGTQIWLTNESGNIYFRECTTIPNHGITRKIPQAELDVTSKWIRSEG